MKEVPTLTERQRIILTEIARSFILTGEPVSSLALSRGGALDVSSATIRNTMSDLAEMGLIAQPHTSAGRVPTVQGLRLFVDELLVDEAQRHVHTPDLARHLDEPFRSHEAVAAADLPALARLACSLLSDVSSLVSLVSISSLWALRLEAIELKPLSDNRMLVLGVTEDGHIFNRVVPLQRPVEGATLTRMQNYLADLVAGRTLDEVRAQIRRELRDQAHHVQDFAQQALMLSEQMLGEVEPVELLVDGAFNFLDYDEFQAQPGRLRQLVRALEEKELVISLLDRLREFREPVVFIGPELQGGLGDDVSVVLCSYYRGEAHIGMLGLMGPLRMDYTRSIALVDRVARLLTESLV